MTDPFEHRERYVFVAIGDNWVRTSEVAAVVREGQDEARIFLRGSSASIRVPLTVEAAMGRIAEASR